MKRLDDDARVSIGLALVWPALWLAGVDPMFALLTQLLFLAVLGDRASEARWPRTS